MSSQVFRCGDQPSWIVAETPETNIARMTQKAAYCVGKVTMVDFKTSCCGTDKASALLRFMHRVEIMFCQSVFGLEPGAQHYVSLARHIIRCDRSGPIRLSSSFPVIVGEAQAASKSLSLTTGHDARTLCRDITSLYRVVMGVTQTAAKTLFSTVARIACTLLRNVSSNHALGVCKIGAN